VRRVVPQYEAIIVGAGFGGMGAAIALKRMGIESICILERASDVGGTWHLNNYPGLAVDIASVTYSYSFEPNPQWSRVYAPGRELKAYATKVADKYALRNHVRFDASVEQVVYDEANKLWTVHVAGQGTVTARILILATGYLSRPSRPKIKGIDSFAGKVIHTAEWDHDYPLEGKRAAVIGTGATAVQLVPEIAKKLGRLDVYQRTAIWVGPKNDWKIAPWVRKLFGWLPLTQKLARFVSTTLLELLTVSAILHNKQLPLLTKIAEQACRRHMRRYIKDKALRRKLTPNYPFGCKRPTFSNSYYKAFTRPNVELVTDPIERIEPDGIVTADGTKRAIDTLVLATGYSVWGRDGFHSIVGRGGVELFDFWRKNRFEAYEGISIPGFPNLFYLPAPYSYTGLSYFFTIEGQMTHMTRCLTAMRERNVRSFEPTEEANREFVERMRERFKSSVFIPGQCTAANSYYFDPHGDPSLIRPTSTLSALRRHDSFPLEHYRFE
jgi:cation diffusion facilitator CzcD-associated flavoprotein CzcO